jgi:signal transduction histidine kinase
VLRSLADRWAPAHPQDTPPPVVLTRFVILIGMLVTVPLAEPRLGAGAKGIVLAVTLGVCAASWLAWMFSLRRDRLNTAALAALGVSGGVLAGLSPLSTAVAAGSVACSAAAIRLRTETSLAITAAITAAFLATALSTAAPPEPLLGWPMLYLGLWVFGLVRYSYLDRAHQAEQMLEQTRRARAAETQAAALAERTRIAPEIHDVLAHSLAAVSVNLQAAEGLLGGLPPDSPGLAKAIGCIERASAFTRDGLAEARRAVHALRDTPVSLAEQFAQLAADHPADGDQAVHFTMTGEERPVAPEAALAVYRTAQESLTNARKHAPGQPVRLRLDFAPEETSVFVTNPLPPPDASRPLTATGGGHGLTGLRERAALAGGALTAGPPDGEWRVALRIPA